MPAPQSHSTGCLLASLALPASIFLLAALLGYQIKEAYIFTHANGKLAGAGILYNPIIPISLSRDTWHILNAVTIALTLLAALTPTCAESTAQTCEKTTPSRSE